MITRREAERLCKSFLGDNSPPRLPDNFAFEILHDCAWGCRGQFVPGRYNSSRAKCIKCSFCAIFFSPNKVAELARSPRPCLTSLSPLVRVPLPPSDRGREIHPAGRGQLQLVAPPHPPGGRPAGRDRPRLGGRQGDVQRRHEEENDVSQSAGEISVSASSQFSSGNILLSGLSTKSPTLQVSQARGQSVLHHQFELRNLSSQGARIYLFV